jgi:hypothetical protein
MLDVGLANPILVGADDDLSSLGARASSGCRRARHEGSPSDCIAPPLAQADPVSRTGDSWLLGNRKLLCGDCTQPQVVGRLLGDVKPHLLIVQA